MTTLTELNQSFKRQRESYSRAQPMSYEERIASLDKIDRMIKENVNELVAALQTDFGQRDPMQILGADISGPIGTIAYVKKHLQRWMKPDKKPIGMMALTGTRQFILNEPLGVVGIMSPFNAPIDLALDPAVEAIAAGNRVMLKISEFTSEAATVLQRLVAQYLDPSVLTVVTGEADVSAAFSALPWDKFVFTGGSETGKKILASAAPNLTPVILELGGKNPAIVLPDADKALAAKKIARSRSGNSGQICLDTDYALVPKDQLNDYIDRITQELTTAFPTYHNNPEFSALINDGAFKRINAVLDEAKRAGTTLITINPNREEMPDAQARLMPFTLAINPDSKLRVAQEEMFGPVLSIFSYETLDEAISLINTHEKSLALYIFGRNQRQIDQILSQTSSGGVDINELSFHAGSHEMGFGGVGYSGMGRYKGGKLGFEAFSNPKSVYKQGRLAKFTSRFMVPIHNPRDVDQYQRLMGIHLNNH